MSAEKLGENYDPMALHADVDASLGEGEVLYTHPRGTGQWDAKFILLKDNAGVPRAFPVENVVNAELFGELPKSRILRHSDSFD